MTAGLPGTGLGGVYYILLVAAMPVREAYLTVRGRSSASRWKIVGSHLALAAGILAALAGFTWMITQAFNFMHRHGLMSGSFYQTAVNASSVTSKLAAIVSVSVLTLLLAGGCLLRVIVKPKGSAPNVCRE